MTKRKNQRTVTAFPAEVRKMNGTSRKAAPLADGFGKRLAAYAAGAGAAGVGLLALAQPASAEIVFTRANVTLTNGSLSIDLNHDGISDFVLGNHRTSSHKRDLAARGLGAGNGIVGYETGCSYPLAALAAGAEIGTAPELFCHSAAPMVNVDNQFGLYIGGPWANVSHRFLGFKFEINHEVHYGWAELSVKAGIRNGTPAIEATLMGYAYETVPNQPIEAGQTLDASALTLKPATLGLLALGSPGLAFWRQKKQEPEVDWLL